MSPRAFFARIVVLQRHQEQLLAARPQVVGVMFRRLRNNRALNSAQFWTLALVAGAQRVTDINLAALLNLVRIAANDARPRGQRAGDEIVISAPAEVQGTLMRVR